MSKALRCAAWGLTAGLFLASPALAQYAAHLPGSNTPAIQQVTPVVAPAFVPAPSTPVVGKATFYTPDVPKGYVLQPVSHTMTVTSLAGQPAGYVLQSVDGEPVTTPVLDSHTKLEEMKVELALLSDPATFGCNLAAQLEGNALLIKGFVPNEAVRERAIQVARTGSQMMIADGLKVHPTLSMRSAGVPAGTLQQAALDLLTESFPEIAQGIEAKAKITGQITLTGSARSFEEKLAVSQKLRRLNGCTSVVNQLKVVPVIKDGVSLTMVSADGQLVVPSELTMDPIAEPAVVQAVPAVQVTVPQAAKQINALEVPPVAPATPAHAANPMEAQPAARTLPLALPPMKPLNSATVAPAKHFAGVTEGTVIFGDDTEEKK
jgi:osmotically-inducible protein OsmY